MRRESWTLPGDLDSGREGGAEVWGQKNSHQHTVLGKELAGSQNLGLGTNKVWFLEGLNLKTTHQAPSHMVPPTFFCSKLVVFKLCVTEPSHLVVALMTEGAG